MLQSHHRDITFNELINFSLLILSDHFRLQIMRRILQDLTYLMPFTISQTHVCLMASLMPPNLTLSLTVHFHAHGYAATHMCITHVHASLPFCHCHVVASCSSYLDMSFIDNISQSDIYMHTQYDSI